MDMIRTPDASIPARWTPELQSLARIIFGFVLFRHGMEQVLGFPAAWVPSEPASFYGIIKLLAFPGGILIMLGLFLRPVCLVLSVMYLVFWFVGPLPDYLAEGRRLFGARGPSDPVLLNGLFFLYLALAGGGAWSVDHLRDPEREAASNSRWAPYSLGILRIVAGFLFIPHGIEKAFGRFPLDVTSFRALAASLELVGGPMLMLGLFTRPVVFLLSGEMAFAYFINHWPERFWGSFVEPNQEASILNCFLFLFLWAAGPGAWRLDGLRRRSLLPERTRSMGIQKTLARLVVVSALLLLPAAASAQSSIVGIVRDSSGGVLPGVTVEAASPALIEKVRSVVTDGEGRYRIVDLRPGPYTVTFTLPGFSAVRREGIELRAEFTATVNADLAVGAVEETLTVTGEAPIVDTRSSRAQVQFERDTLEFVTEP